MLIVKPYIAQLPRWYMINPNPKTRPCIITSNNFFSPLFYFLQYKRRTIIFHLLVITVDSSWMLSKRLIWRKPPACERTTHITAEHDGRKFRKTFFWVRLTYPINMNALFEKALKEGILLNPRTIYDRNATDYLRISYAYIDLHKMDTAIHTLTNIVIKV